jgi:hypothetical protein
VAGPNPHSAIAESLGAAERPERAASASFNTSVTGVLAARDAGNRLCVNGPVAATVANNWQIPMNMAIPVNVGVKYTFRAKLIWTDNSDGMRQPPVFSNEKDVTP